MLMVSAVLARFAKAAKVITAVKQTTYGRRVNGVWNPGIDFLSPL